jgi:hypothetical protein
MHINHDVKIDDLNKNTYKFYLSDRNGVLILDSYHIMTRPTKRHKFRSVNFYDRFSRKEQPWRNDKIERADVPLTDQMKQSIIQKLISQISFE